MVYVKNKLTGEIHECISDKIPVVDEAGHMHFGFRLKDNSIIYNKIIYDADPVNLCNKFIFVKQCWRKEMFRLKFKHMKFYQLESYIKDGYTIYGAVWTSQGLIFRIKMIEIPKGNHVELGWEVINNG